MVHQLTGGVPRLMNLVCERALVGAFSKQQEIVGSDIVKQAASESLPIDFIATNNKVSKIGSIWPYSAAALMLFCAGIGLSFIL